jgi:tRNA-2-methylthio-N6-dimethylallyladenosine synthase
MNKSDAERASSLLESMNFKKTSLEEEANLICVQACSVRQSAVNRIKSRIKKWQGWQKERGPQNPLITVLTGCVLPKDRAVFEKQFDLVIETEKLVQELPRVVVETRQCLVSTPAFFALQPKHTSLFQAYVPIQTGCNNFCTYCAVPYTKGREHYRPHKQIVQEVENLAKDGYKEITLLGQNVNTYHVNVKCQMPARSPTRMAGGANVKTKPQNSKPNDKVRFSDLLRMINDISGDFWIRFVSSNPWDMSLATIRAVAGCKKVCEYIHLPLQSGSDQILKKMNRRYTQKEYLALVDKIRSTIPNAAITTDIIVGFPGETRADFLETAKVMKAVKFDMAYIARYSPRPGTVAARFMEDDVSAQEKKKREKYLERILRKSALGQNKKYVGKVIEVLVEKLKTQNSNVKTKSQNSKLFLGKTRTFKVVKFEGDEDLIGKFVKVKITRAREFGLDGKL